MVEKIAKEEGMADVPKSNGVEATH